MKRVIKMVIICIILCFATSAYGEIDIDNYSFVYEKASDSKILAIPTRCNDHLFLVQKPDGSVWLYQVFITIKGHKSIIKTIVFRKPLTIE